MTELEPKRQPLEGTALVEFDDDTGDYVLRVTILAHAGEQAADLVQALDGQVVRLVPQDAKRPATGRVADRFDSYEPRADVPAVGSTWIWEPLKSHAREHITVLEVKWNGEEWWVRTTSERGPRGSYWNDLSRFWSAVWPDPDPNNLKVGEEITWMGPPCFARKLPSGWEPRGLGNRRDWSKVGEHRWRRVS